MPSPKFARAHTAKSLSYTQTERAEESAMGWLRLVGSIKLYVSLAKEPYKTDNILQKRPIILSILLAVATPKQEKQKQTGHKEQPQQNRPRID